MKPFLSIDVGGSAIKYGVITDGTTFLYRSQCPTPKNSMEDLLDAYRALYADCAAYGPFEGVAISFTASMDGRTGYCFGGSLEKYTKGENLLEVFQSVFEEPVAVENDGNCGALAEGRYGSLAGLESGMVIILGTGLGGGLLTNGHIHRGKRSCSGEFSYIFVDPRTAFEGRPDVWAIHSGFHGLTRPLAIAKGEPEQDGRHFFALAEAGDADALRILKDYTNYLAVWIYNLQCIYAPEKFAIGGGISLQPLLMEYLQNSLKTFYERNDAGLPHAEVVPATFHGSAGLIGAVCWWEDFYGKKS